MAAVAALLPANAFEAELAAQIVTANAQAMDALRVAALPGQDPEKIRRNHAWAATMMRQMHNGLRLLHRTQEIREKAEAALQPAAMERAGYWFHDVSVPLPEPAPAQPDPEPAPTPTARTEAEHYAVIYPERAARIRADRGLPSRLDFAPPEPKLVDAIVNGTSPILRALDHNAPAAAAA